MRVNDVNRYSNNGRTYCRYDHPITGYIKTIYQALIHAKEVHKQHQKPEL